MLSADGVALGAGVGECVEVGAGVGEGVEVGAREGEALGDGVGKAVPTMRAATMPRLSEPEPETMSTLDDALTIVVDEVTTTETRRAPVVNIRPSCVRFASVPVTLMRGGGACHAAT